VAQIVRSESRALLTVTEWNLEQEQSCEVHFASTRRRLPPSILGVLGTVLLHALLIPSFVAVGTSGRKAPALKIYGPGSISTDTNTSAAQTLVLLQPIASPPATDSLREEFGSRGSTLRNQPIVLIRPGPAPPVADLKIDATDTPNVSAALATGDNAGNARLVGIYSGQIQARIERLWRRPRTPVSDRTESGKTVDVDATFQCQVQIVQDPNGNVQEVLLPNCNGSSAWQRSLVMAINQASPLPAPPDPAVFSPIVTLQFVGLSYAKGSSPEEYEIAPPPLAQSGSMD
jgi:hypothetical protein